MYRAIRVCVPIALVLLGFAGPATQRSIGAAAQLETATFVPAQAEAGKAVYARQCELCHGSSLENGEFGPPVRGVDFQQRWGGKTLDTLLAHITERMPPAAPASLSDDEYVAVLAFLLQQNGVPSGARALPAEPETLKALMMPAPSNSVGRLSPGVSLPPPPVVANPLDRLTPVTEAMLANPSQGDWLTWRRTPDAQGFSPLAQINKTNVARLQPAWGWSLAAGPNEGTPLVHDGVMFIQSYGDKVQALDAARGSLLWQYSRRLPKGMAPSFKKAMALYGQRLYLLTSDSHIVALNTKTGAMVWDSPIATGPQFRATGGPLVAKGKVIVGTVGRAPGGNFIVALDAETGKEAWRFATLARPGEPGGESWNGLPVEARNGGSIWVPGSYDPTLNLVFFGPAPTYDTAPLRDLAPGGQANNDALFTNTTIALNPDTGKLVWHFPHLTNDQWDLDWAFERQILPLTVRGGVKPVVVTSGKPAIFDVVEAQTGKYAFSIDLGLQNFVLEIDPETGAKKTDPRLVPGDGQTKFVCPHAVGGKNWLPSSVNAASKVLFVSLTEACMNLMPVDPGERGLLSTGARLTLVPPRNSDGKYGRLEAINLETRQRVWVDRQRAPITTGTLATAGGLVFTGSMDREFAAYDDATGKKLWRTRLNDVPSSNAISYSVNGKQYVAVVVGNGGLQAMAFASLVPEILNPPDRSSAVWVFELPEAPQ